MTLIRVDIACNSPDNGLFEGRCAGIQLPALNLELAAIDIRGPVFHADNRKVKLSRRVFPIVRSKEWCGNWCWNAYWLNLPVLINLLAYAHFLGLFSPEQGEDWLFDRWHDRKPFEVIDRLRLRDCLETSECSV